MSESGEIYSSDKTKPTLPAGDISERYGNNTSTPATPSSQPPPPPPLSASLVRAASSEQPFTAIGDGTPILKKTGLRSPTQLRQIPSLTIILCLLTVIAILVGLLITRYNGQTQQTAVSHPTPTLNPAAVTATFISSSRDFEQKPACPFPSKSSKWINVSGKIDCTNGTKSIFIGSYSSYSMIPPSVRYSPAHLSQDYMFSVTVSDLPPGGGKYNNIVVDYVTAFVSLSWSNPKDLNSAINVEFDIGQDGVGYLSVGTFQPYQSYYNPPQSYYTVAPTGQYVMQMIYHKGKITYSVNGLAVKLPKYQSNFSNVPETIEFGVSEYPPTETPFQASFQNFTYQLLSSLS